MARYPPAIWRPCPKHGYRHDDTLREEGIVGHSMEGSLAAAFGELDRLDRDASWHFSVAKDGDVYQHLDTGNISYASGSYDANRRFWSIEHEGVAGEPLTAPQTEATADLMGWLLAIKGLPAIRHQTMWEHREMVAYGASPTACPSGRIPWTEIIAEIEGGGDMPLSDQDKAAIRSIVADEIRNTLRAPEFALGAINFRVGQGVKLDDVMKAVQGIPGATIDATVEEIANATADEFARRQQD